MVWLVILLVSLFSFLFCLEKKGSSAIPYISLCHGFFLFLTTVRKKPRLSNLQRKEKKLSWYSGQLKVHIQVALYVQLLVKGTSLPLALSQYGREREREAGIHRKI